MAAEASAQAAAEAERPATTDADTDDRQLAAPSARMRMASAFPAGTPLVGTLAKRIEAETWRVSGGRLQLEFQAPGRLGALDEMLDVVAAGSADAAFDTMGRWAGAAPAFQLFASVPFGPPAREYLAWMDFGGGKSLYEELLHGRGVHGVICGVISPEGAGWFREEITSTRDLKGLRMRIFGLGARVMAKLGVEPRPLQEGEIFLALENGSIDAAEYSMPAVDRELGFQTLLKHYYFPGWHQPATLLSLIINLDLWNDLSATQRAQIEAVCGDNVRYGLAEGEAIQFGALKELYASGVKLHRWPAAMMESFRGAWDQVVAEEIEADADFRRVWRSLNGFRRDYAIWDELGRP